MNGFAVLQQYDTQISSFGFVNNRPTPNSSVRLDRLLDWVRDNPFNPIQLNTAAIRTLSHTLKILGELHAELYGLIMSDVTRLGAFYRESYALNIYLPSLSILAFAAKPNSEFASFSAIFCITGRLDFSNKPIARSLTEA